LGHENVLLAHRRGVAGGTPKSRLAGRRILEVPELIDARLQRAAREPGRFCRHRIWVSLGPVAAVVIAVAMLIPTPSPAASVDDGRTPQAPLGPNHSIPPDEFLGKTRQQFAHNPVEGSQCRPRPRA